MEVRAGSKIFKSPAATFLLLNIHTRCYSHSLSILITKLLPSTLSVVYYKAFNTTLAGTFQLREHDIEITFRTYNYSLLPKYRPGLVA